MCSVLSTCRPCRGWRERRERGASSSRISYPSLRPGGQSSLIPSLLLSPSNPLRWASMEPPIVGFADKPQPAKSPTAQGRGALNAYCLVHAAHVGVGGSGGSGGLRRRGFHIPRFALAGKARSFHRSSSPHRTRFAGLRWSPQSSASPTSPSLQKAPRHKAVGL